MCTRRIDIPVPIAEEAATKSRSSIKSGNPLKQKS